MSDLLVEKLSEPLVLVESDTERVEVAVRVSDDVQLLERVALKDTVDENVVDDVHVAVGDPDADCELLWETENEKLSDEDSEDVLERDTVTEFESESLKLKVNVTDSLVLEELEFERDNEMDEE